MKYSPIITMSDVIEVTVKVVLRFNFSVTQEALDDGENAHRDKR